MFDDKFEREAEKTFAILTQKPIHESHDARICTELEDNLGFYRSFKRHAL